MTDSRTKAKKPPTPWTEFSIAELNRFNLTVAECSDLRDILPKDFAVSSSNGKSLRARLLREDAAVTPETLLSESRGVVDRSEDFLISAFREALEAIRVISVQSQLDDDVRARDSFEAYARQSLYDFVRLLFLANKSILAKSSLGDVHIRYHIVCWSLS